MTKVVVPDRHRLPDTRPSLTHRRVICGHKCYFTVSFFDEHPADLCKPAEVFVQIAKQGSMVAGLMDGAVTLLSVALQHGIPWDVLKEKLQFHKFGNENNDLDHTSLYDGLVKAVDHLIEERRSIIGDIEITELNTEPGKYKVPQSGYSGGPLVRWYKCLVSAPSKDGRTVFNMRGCAYSYEDGSVYFTVDDPAEWLTVTGKDSRTFVDIPGTVIVKEIE